MKQIETNNKTHKEYFANLTTPIGYDYVLDGLFWRVKNISQGKLLWK